MAAKPTALSIQFGLCGIVAAKSQARSKSKSKFESGEIQHKLKETNATTRQGNLHEGCKAALLRSIPLLVLFCIFVSYLFCVVFLLFLLVVVMLLLLMLLCFFIFVLCCIFIVVFVFAVAAAVAAAAVI